MSAPLIHRSNSNGRPLCGAPCGRISTSGFYITCEECKRLSAPPDRAAQLRSLQEAAARYRYRCNRCKRPMRALTCGEEGCNSGACECGGLIEADPQNWQAGGAA